MAWFEHGQTRIYYELYGSGDPVLLMPGFTGSIEDVSALGRSLAERHSVIAADLPGSGRSAPQPRTYPPTFYEDDARTFIDLLEELGTGPAHLIGFSDGGEVSLVMAGMDPAIARSVVAWGAAGFFDANLLPILDAIETVVDSPIEPFRDWSERLKSAYGEDNARSTTRSFVSACRAILDAGGEIGRARADKIGCPALLIAGEDDELAPPALVSQIASAMNKAEVRSVPKGGHDIHRSHPDWLAQTVLEWLAAH